MPNHDRVTIRPETSIFVRNVAVQMTTKYVDSTPTVSTPSTPTEKNVTTKLPTIKKKTDSKQTKSIPSPYVSSFKILKFTPRLQTGARKVSTTSKPSLTRTLATSPLSVRDEGTKTGARKVSTTSKPSLTRSLATSPLSVREECTKTDEKTVITSKPSLTRTSAISPLYPREEGIKKQFRNVAVQMTTKYVDSTPTDSAPGTPTDSTSTDSTSTDSTSTDSTSTDSTPTDNTQKNSTPTDNEPTELIHSPPNRTLSLTTRKEDPQMEVMMVGVGGGWVLLREYRKHHGRIEVHMQSSEESKTGKERVLIKSIRHKNYSTENYMPPIRKGIRCDAVTV